MPTDGPKRVSPASVREHLSRTAQVRGPRRFRIQVAEFCCVARSALGRRQAISRDTPTAITSRPVSDASAMQREWFVAALSTGNAVHLLLPEPRGGRIRLQYRLQLIASDEVVDAPEPFGRRRSTISITPSGPPPRFICTTRAVLGRRASSYARANAVHQSSSKQLSTAV